MSSSVLQQQAPAETASVTCGDALGVSDEVEKILLTRKRKTGQTGLSESVSPSPEGSLGPRKRGGRKGASKEGDELDDAKLDTSDDPIGSNTKSQAAADTNDLKPIMRSPMSKAREMRLEQNRKAARESRRRKKVMIEELQRSVIFFSRANGTLKQQNDELQRMLVQAQAQVQAVEQNGAATQGQPSDGVTAVAPGYAAVPASVPAPAPADSSEPAASAQASQQAPQQAQVQAPLPQQNLKQNPQAVVANPFVAAAMGMGVHQTTGAPGAAAPAPGAPAPAPGTPAATPTANPMDAFNQFAMQQQFAAQLGAIGAVGVPAGANPFFQQQAAAMQLAAAGQMAQWGAPAAALQPAPPANVAALGPQ